MGSFSGQTAAHSPHSVHEFTIRLERCAPMTMQSLL